MAKPKVSPLSLGQLQADLEAATRNLAIVTKAKLKADQTFEEALASHEQAKINLNAGFSAVKAATTIPNIYAS